MNVFDDFSKRRKDGNNKILSQDFTPIKRYFALDRVAYKDGSIPVKHKELMGLTGSLILRCNDCITYHLENCLAEKVTREELLETFNIALVIGGSVIIPHIRHAYEVIDAIEETKKITIFENQ